MTKHRSISMILSRTKDIDERLEIACQWASNWHRENLALQSQTKEAIAQGDMRTAEVKLYQLGMINSKKLQALSRVLYYVSGVDFEADDQDKRKSSKDFDAGLNPENKPKV